MKSELAIKRDEWFKSDEGKKCLDFHTMKSYQDGKYLKNRLELAFLAGDKAMDKGIRSLMLECPEFVRKALLTDDQIRIYNIVKDQGGLGFRSSELREIDNLSKTNASEKLRILEKKGYLKKKVVNRGVGGKENVYTAIEF